MESKMDKFGTIKLERDLFLAALVEIRNLGPFGSSAIPDAAYVIANEAIGDDPESNGETPLFVEEL